MKKRDYNIEVLRCAMMFIIVLGHMSAMGPYSGDKAVHGVFTLSYFATDAFVFISGWYGVTFRWNKVLNMLGLGLYVSVVLSSLSYTMLGQWQYNYSLGWFGNAYLTLLLLTPIINEGLAVLHEKLRLNQAWASFAAASLLSWLPFCDFAQIAPPGWTGTSTLAIIFVYITGRVVSYSLWVKKITKTKALTLFAMLMAANIMWSYMALLSHGHSSLERLFVETRCNNAPLTIALALSVFLLFKTISFPRWLGRVCCFVAPSLFPIYLLHLGTFPEVSKKLFYRFAFIHAETAFGRFGSFVLAAVLVFCTCLVIDLLRRLLGSVIGRITIRPLEEV